MTQWMEYSTSSLGVPMGELWPGQVEHYRAYDAMMTEFATTGVYRDPVGGRVFPPGRAMLREPNREERRRLDRWRTTGKVKGTTRATKFIQPCGSKVG